MIWYLPFCSEPLDSRPGLLSAGVTFFRGNEGTQPLKPLCPEALVLSFLP